jgi:hypothetical protein
MTLMDGFEVCVNNLAPSIRRVQPAFSDIRGGRVNITVEQIGEFRMSTVSVLIGETPCDSLEQINGTLLSCLIPPVSQAHVASITVATRCGGPSLDSVRLAAKKKECHLTVMNQNHQITMAPYTKI